MATPPHTPLPHNSALSVSNGSGNSMGDADDLNHQQILNGKDTITIRLGCVPEHFSVPLQMAVNSGKFTRHGLNVQIVICPGGTGEMIKRMAANEIDVAVALTEGLLAPLLKGQGNTLGYRIMGTYTSTALTWSVAVSPAKYAQGVFQPSRLPPTNTPVTPQAMEAALLDSLQGKTIGISRFGSGSHIMPYVIAHQRYWKPTKCATPISLLTTSTTTPQQQQQHQQPFFKFIELSNIDGLRNGIISGTADAFLWERFTTKRYYDSGELHHLTNVTPQWPAFLIAGTTRLLQTVPAGILHTFLKQVSAATQEFMAVENRDLSVSGVMEYCGYKDEGDVRNWFETVAYPMDARAVELEMLEKCKQILEGAGVVEPRDGLNVNAILGLETAVLV